jgi:hypothetical protein
LRRVAADGHQLQRNFVSFIDTATDKVAAKISAGKNAFKQISCRYGVDVPYELQFQSPNAFVLFVMDQAMSPKMKLLR